MRVGVKPARPVQDFPDGTRLCNGCAVRKPLDEFPKDPNATAGRRSNCKPCHTARAKDWYAANRDEHLPRQKARYHRDIEKMRARDRARYERDKPKRIELAVESVHRRRALLRSVPNDRGITYQALREKFGDLCHYCRATMTFEPADGRTYIPSRATIEHLAPLARGGHHTWDNVVLACWQCNVRKNATPLEEWLERETTDGMGEAS